MKIELYKGTKLVKTIDNVLMATGNDENFKIITKDKEHLFTIEHHKIFDEDKNVYDKLIEINEKVF